MHNLLVYKFVVHALVFDEQVAWQRWARSRTLSVKFGG